MSNILVVEDSSDSFELIKRALGNMNVLWAKSKKEATTLINQRSFDLILLDIMLPDGDGYSLCSMLRLSDMLAGIPVIFLTGKTSTTDKVFGFSVGGDDYISKPFDPLELKARVEAKLRKRQRELRDQDLISIGGIEIDRSAQRVSIQNENGLVPVDLTSLEFRILVMLASRPNEVISRDDILGQVWGKSVFVYSRSVDTHVSKLRRKLGEKGACIGSVHGVGYRFICENKESPLPLMSIPKQMSDLSAGAIAN